MEIHLYDLKDQKGQNRSAQVLYVNPKQLEVLWSKYF